MEAKLIMKKCPKCGEEGTGKYCGICGTQLPLPPVVQPVQPPPVAQPKQQPPPVQLKQKKKEAAGESEDNGPMNINVSGSANGIISNGPVTVMNSTIGQSLFAAPATTRYNHSSAPVTIDFKDETPKRQLSHIIGIKKKKLNTVWDYFEENGYDNTQDWGRIIHLANFFEEAGLKEFHVRKWAQYFNNMAEN